MKLIIGLGNPDKKYQHNRHNLGQRIVVDFVKSNFKAILKEKKNLSANLFETGQGINKIIFATPTEYMNNSGLSVKKISQFYKINLQDIYVIHDDLDLPLGDYRLQFDRGAAGHNGVRSIIDSLNSQQFHRLRLGIGKGEDGIPTEDYVLQSFNSQEEEIVSNLSSDVFKEIKNII